MLASEKNWAISVINLQELDVVATVFRKIVTESWFVRDIRQRQKFAALVIRTYQGGMKNECDLYGACFQVAKDEFAGSGLAH
jgi:hypothetical protein